MIRFDENLLLLIIMGKNEIEHYKTNVNGIDSRIHSTCTNIQNKEHNF